MTFKHKIAYRNALCGHIEEWIQKTSLTKCLFCNLQVLTKRKKGYNVTNSYICSLQDRDNAKDRGQFEKLD